MEPKDRLSAHAEGLRGQRFIEHNESNGFATQVLPEVKHQALISCHQTLIRLGDLSRYRVTERLDKDRNWGPAVGYYGLAGTLRPSSGQSYNQQAVVALAEGNHLNATYNLYRAIAVEEPDPNAPGNLEIEFKKIVSAWSKGELIRRDSNAPAKALVAWFIRLHSKCYKGQAFSEHDELENEVMSQLAVELKERPLDGTLHKFVLINAAAQYIASQRWHNNVESSEALQAYLFFFRLNIKTFLTLLRLLQADLERISPEDRDFKQGERAQMLSDKITATTRRILPALRLYSCWALVNARIRSVALVGDAALEQPMRELWKAYAAALSLLAAAFPIEVLPTADYLLEEDADTIGFKPLISDRTMKNWYKEGVSGVLKPKFFDQGVERQHPNVEMLMRIRGLLWDGLLLAVDESIPLTVQDFRFIYESSGTASERTANLADNSLLAPVMSVQPSDALRSSEISKIVDTRTLHDLAPSNAPASLSIQMSRMVDDLVGSDADVLDVLPEDEEDLPPTPPEQTFEDTAVVASNGETSYGVGSLTAHELVHMASKFSQNKFPSGRRTSPPARLNPFGTPSAVRHSHENGISNGTPSPPAQRLTPLPDTVAVILSAAWYENDTTRQVIQLADNGLDSRSAETLENHGPSRATLVAAVLIPMAAVALLGAIVFFLLRRRRKGNSSRAAAVETKEKLMRGDSSASRYTGPPPDPYPAVFAHYSAPPPDAPLMTRNEALPVILSTTMSSTYFTGLDTSEANSLHSNNNNAGPVDGINYNRSSGEEPPPPYRTRSEAAQSQRSTNSSLRHFEAAHSSDTGLTTAQRADSNPFADPAEEFDAVSPVEGGGMARHYGRDSDELSAVSDLSYQNPFRDGMR
ncbi:hypothetical protein B0A49_07657 [Cryomyces minteri]|uniref:Nonsense-mediated mRNA decay factor n=1 Tax=Cryomyces minteri TaxID=331657 RepID=A0A4U0X698_9PEZI|nr:hypothetical protein B0A49_07657 [Cryomyces minteri]